jgi:hypothetical protein
VSWTIRHEPEGEIVWITTKGVHTPEDVARMAREAVAEGDRLGWSRYLVDDREMTPDLRLLDVYKLPRLFEGWGLPAGARLAVVYWGASPRAEDWRFLETAAGNFGGVEVRVFADAVEEARAWLSGGGGDKA